MRLTTALALVAVLARAAAAADLEKPSPRYLLERADEALRDGRTDTAAAVLAAVLLEAPGPPWTGYADLGLVIVGLRGGDLELAATHAERLRASPAHAPAAELLVGLVDAARGRPAEAGPRLEAVAAGPQRQSVRATAALGAAYALFWARRWNEAATRFDAVVTQFPGGPLVDDARYGAAWSRWLAGERERALGDLRELAGTRGLERGRVSRALQALEPAAVLSAGMTRAATPPLLRSDGQPIAALDVDGAMLAGAALRRVDPAHDGADRVETEPAARDAAAEPPARDDAGMAPKAREPPDDSPDDPVATPPSAKGHEDAAGGAAATLGVVASALAVLGLALWWLRCRRRSA